MTVTSLAVKRGHPSVPCHLYYLGCTSRSAMARAHCGTPRRAPRRESTASPHRAIPASHTESEPMRTTPSAARSLLSLARGFHAKRRCRRRATRGACARRSSSLGSGRSPLIVFPPRTPPMGFPSLPHLHDGSSLVGKAANPDAPRHLTDVPPRTPMFPCSRSEGPWGMRRFLPSG